MPVPLREEDHGGRGRPRCEPAAETNKNDYIDAEAIAEAVGRPRMRFVSIKTDDQLDPQSLHRVRERWVSGRTAVINQIRGLLLEMWHHDSQGRHHIEVVSARDPGRCRQQAVRGIACIAQHNLRLEMQYLGTVSTESDKLYPADRR